MKSSSYRHINSSVPSDATPLDEQLSQEIVDSLPLHIDVPFKELVAQLGPLVDLKPMLDPQDRIIGMTPVVNYSADGKLPPTLDCGDYSFAQDVRTSIILGIRRRWILSLLQTV